jgi:hypothetical protein
MTRREWFSTVLLTMGLLIGFERANYVHAQAPKVYSYYDSRRREDFTATVDGQTFQTTAGVRNSYIEVYRNGLLQRPGALGLGDYVSVAVGAAQKITFNPHPAGQVPAVDDYVTIFYYPN